MVSKKQVQISKKIGKTRRNSRWIKGRKELSHHSSKIILWDSQILEKPERLRQVVKGQGNHLSNVRVVK
jgi:hypothetical protein